MHTRPGQPRAPAQAAQARSGRRTLSLMTNHRCSSTPAFIPLAQPSFCAFRPSIPLHSFNLSAHFATSSASLIPRSRARPSSIPTPSCILTLVPAPRQARPAPESVARPRIGVAAGAISTVNALSYPPVGRPRPPTPYNGLPRAAALKPASPFASAVPVRRRRRAFALRPGALWRTRVVCRSHTIRHRIRPNDTAAAAAAKPR